MATLREIAFVFPQLNQIKNHPDLSAARRVFIDPLHAKLLPEITALSAKEADLIIVHGERDGELEKFKLKTKQQSAAFQAAFKAHKNNDSDVKLTKEEQPFFDMLYWTAVIGGYKDFYDI